MEIYKKIKTALLNSNHEIVRVISEKYAFAQATFENSTLDKTRLYYFENGMIYLCKDIESILSINKRLTYKYEVWGVVTIDKKDFRTLENLGYSQKEMFLFLTIERELIRDLKNFDSLLKVVNSYVTSENETVIYKRRLKITLEHFKEFVKWYGYDNIKICENWFSNTYYISDVDTKIICDFFGVKYENKKTYLRFD